MACYRKGGCGPYENRSCNECPASNPEYADKYKVANTAKTEEEPVKVKIFINKDGIISALTSSGEKMAIEVINKTQLLRQLTRRQHRCGLRLICVSCAAMVMSTSTIQP